MLKKLFHLLTNESHSLDTTIISESLRSHLLLHHLPKSKIISEFSLTFEEATLNKYNLIKVVNPLYVGVNCLIASLSYLTLFMLLENT